MGSPIDVLELNIRDDRERVCLNCTLPICDEGAAECLYRIAVGKDVKKPDTRFADMISARQEQVAEIRASFVPDTRFGLRYDRRRKPDTPRRAWERKYRAKRRRVFSTANLPNERE